MRLVLVSLLTLGAVAQAEEPDPCTVKRRRVSALSDVLATVHDATPEYRALVIARIADAKKQADACERVESATRRAEAAQKASEREAAEQAAKRAAADKLTMDQLRSEPSFLRLVWSSYLCTFEAERAAAQQRLTALESGDGGGELIDPFARTQQLETIRRDDATLTRARALLKRGKILPVSCRQKDVAAFAVCLMDPSRDLRCGTADVALAIRAEADIVASGQVTPAPAPLGMPPHATPENEDLGAEAPADADGIYMPKW
jgi:hypothetical protein